MARFKQIFHIIKLKKKEKAPSKFEPGIFRLLDRHFNQLSDGTVIYVCVSGAHISDKNVINIEDTVLLLMVVLI